VFCGRFSSPWERMLWCQATAFAHSFSHDLSASVNVVTILHLVAHTWKANI
jgi:hypothetical protein